jgi:hypothetical protein
MKAWKIVVLVCLLVGVGIVLAQVKPNLKEFAKSSGEMKATAAGAKAQSVASEESKKSVASEESKKKVLDSTASDFKKLAAEHFSFSAADCRTVCSAKVIIGPDGKPQTVLECSLVCGF